MSRRLEPRKVSEWQNQAYLDALRPDPGCEVRGAILTSYSADVASIVAALLALAGRDNDNGSGAKSDLAEAIEMLRGKVRILIQRGRLARPRRIPIIAGILDQFVRQIDLDERKQSWHPKISLVEFGNGNATSDWRLWLGSRNLTTAVNRDFGLLLKSNSDHKALDPSPIPGAAEMAERLAAYADLKPFKPARLKATINVVRWTHPDRLHVERITLTGGEGSDKSPIPPKEIDEVIAVSPFLDGGIIKSIGSWGGPRTRRSLLSTELALTKIASQASKPLAGFKDNIFVLDTPAPETVEPSALAMNDDGSTDDDETEELPIGLHAKIFAVRKAKRLRLWVGSANATQRAWSGLNVEVIAEIAASLSVQDGLNALLGGARGISAAVLEARVVPKDDGKADQLDEARKEFVASWSGGLARDGDNFRLQCAKPPHPSDARIKLEAGLATAALMHWPTGDASLFLGEYPAGLHTGLVQFRLSIGGLSCVWLQCVAVTPPFDDDRDHHAIARHLGMHAFLKWIAALMAGEAGSDGNDSWDDPPSLGQQSQNNQLLDGSMLTLDAMLACWARDPGAFRRVGQRIRLHAGRKEERAFLTALLGRAYPYLTRRFPDGVMRRNVKSDWDGLVRANRAPVAKLSYRFIGAFKSAVRIEFGERFEPLIPAIFQAETAGRFVGRLRRALGHAVLLDRPPDLVILDEFQRYRDMLSKENRSDPLIAALFEAQGDWRPALLLLSATPYKLYATRLEENRGADANRELFDLVEFLGGKRGSVLKSKAEDTFAKFGRTILAIAKHHDDPAETERLVAEAQGLREHLQSMLAPYLSRMERAPTSDDSAKTIPLSTSLDQSDVRAFRHLASSFKPEHSWFALPYWLSVPLPAQTLGNRYLAWREATIRTDRSLTKFTIKSRDRFSTPRSWPHPKLRALAAVTPPDTLALPWVAPSISWWDLRGAWERPAQEQKLLLFSRFKSTPQSIAALTSFGVEARYLARSGAGYENVWKRRRLQSGPQRLPIVALFHPSPFLISATDPLAAPSSGGAPPRATIRKQLMVALKKRSIDVIRGAGKKGKRRKPLWALLSGLESISGDAKLTKNAWNAVASTDQRLRTLVDQWHSGHELEWISRRELDDLVTAALAAPGVIVGRALLRHFPNALSADNFEKAVRLAWHGLRAYLDNPVFWARLPAGKAVNVLQRACLDGNLEAVLDEHFWMRRQSLPTGARGLAIDLLEALNISTGGFSLHSVNEKRSPRIHVRCHVAVPFGSTEDKDRTEGAVVGEQAPRSDELRNAFNSPFWPHVLATTSVGQEGLDFHTWCSRILHWDLCSGPIELEQREGRIQRFGGLAVRRQLEKLSQSELREAGAIAMHTSLWDRVQQLANTRHLDASGLSPWWVLENAKVSRYVFNLPQSRDLDRFELLKEQRLIYRLALGQPNQEDLVEFLAKGGSAITATLQPLALNLSAFARRESGRRLDLV